MDIQKKNLAEGITLYMLPDEKFKNCVQGIYFTMPLQRETATGLALLPKLLTADNSVYSDRMLLHMQAESLYGTRIKASSRKVGEAQVVSFTADAIADQYAGEKLFSAVNAVLRTVICEPKGEGSFTNEVFEREKEALRENIKGIVNDKRQYALLRCIDEMCKDEAFGIRADGTEDELDELTPDNTFSLYKKMLSSAKVDIIITGSFDKETALVEVKKFADKIGPRTAFYPKTTQRKTQTVQYIEDHESVLQGKLVIGYRTDIDVMSDDYYALLVYNGIFGGGTSSKLFNNVREKMSLCYYASSQLERSKGLMFVQSGIEFDKFQMTLDAVRAQHDEIIDGKISESEFLGAVQGIVNTLRSYKDSPATLQAYYLQQLSSEEITDIDLTIKKIFTVKQEQIPIIARQVYMDTVYFLNGEGGKTR